MALLFTWKFNQYKNKAAFQVMEYCLTTKKGATMIRKLNMALILLSVCRNALTWLRLLELDCLFPSMITSTSIRHPFSITSASGNDDLSVHIRTESSTYISRSEDSRNSFTSSSAIPCGKKKSRRTTHAHFYWVTREPGSFKWFNGIMDEIAVMDHKVPRTLCILLQLLMRHSETPHIPD
ncbi:hypothetical protein GIB67_013033 [Kingdonia uniflora]|uniref:Uncharacterized protein n=1 Tax=Kingdonia uniflora TaxID=39325 RepID=A0A7J7MCG0_9MAGN|nr:hypothetical protein GIB67_013033 [Kingdonia uniflora]